MKKFYLYTLWLILLYQPITATGKEQCTNSSGKKGFCITEFPDSSTTLGITGGRGGTKCGSNEDCGSNEASGHNYKEGQKELITNEKVNANKMDAVKGSTQMMK